MNSPQIDVLSKTSKCLKEKKRKFQETLIILILCNAIKVRHMVVMFYLGITTIARWYIFDHFYKPKYKA